jgi:hypothetical protein
MPEPNPFDQLLTPTSREPSAASETPANPFDNISSSGGGGVSSSEPPASSSSNPFDSLATSPLTGQPQEPAQHIYQDSSQPWYKRAWDFAQTPLTESVFGLPEERQGAGGFERAVEHIASGLTSPLSVALTAATFGGGGLIESAGATALKESGEFAAEEIPQMIKAGEAATKAAGELSENPNAVTNAIKQAGVDPSRWKTAQDILYNNKLTEHDLIGGNMLERGAFQIARKVAPDLPIAASVAVAKTGNALLSAGFTLQQFESAAEMSPRFFDDLKNGDTDAAWEHGTEALVGAGLGIAGAGHALHAAGELFDPILSTKLRPSDTSIALKRTIDTRDAQHAVAEQEAVNFDKQLRQTLGHENPNPVTGDKPEVAAQKKLELASVLHQVVTGGDADKAAAWHNALAEAAGKEDRLPTDYQDPNESQTKQQIETNNFSKLPKDYQDLILNSLQRVAKGELSDKELTAAKLLREAQDKNFEIGSANGLLTHHIDDYMSRWYKDENPDGRVISSQAKSGSFATKVTMARQRVYDSHLTALLKAKKQLELDPVDVTAQGRAQLIKAAANKQMFADMRDKFTQGSDGRPAVVLSGSGRVLSSEGEDPTTFIKPESVQLINVADKVVKHLEDSGDLQRYLDEGSLKDITPYVHPGNIGAAIDRLEESSIKRNAEYDPEGNNKLQTQIMLLKSMFNNQDYSGLKDFNEGLKKQYAWDPSDYISLDHPSMRGWNFASNDSAGHKILVDTSMRVHPEFAEYFKNRLGLEESGIAKNPIGKAVLGAGTKLKHTLLWLSPFHMVQEALRGVMVGVNPITAFREALRNDHPDILTGDRVDPNDPNSPTKIYKGVQNGLNTGTDYKSMQDHSEEFSAGGGGLLRRIPGIGKTLDNSMNWYEDFLFKRYIPALKARAYELMFDRYREAHPDWEIDRVAKAAASHTNDTFGGINWKAMGRSATTQDWGRLMLLAPDWLEAEMRSGARLFNKEGGIGRAQVAKMALGMWGIARVLNVVSTGSFHNEAPFGLVVKNKEGKETVFGIRTLPTDLLHAASDPVGFLKGRLSPVIGATGELVSGRDRYGRKLQPEDLWVDTFRNMTPIPVQSIGQAVTSTGPEVGNVGQAWKAVGGTAQSYQSPAGKMAADLAASHSEDGFVDPAQQARHRMIIRFEDMARAGELSQPDLMKMTYQTDQLTESELKKIQTNIKATKDMDPTTAALYTRATRLPAKEYLQLLDVANSTEKTALIPLTKKVREKYLSKGKDKMTPEERAKDPVYQRFLRMIPPQPQTEQ